MIHNQVIDSFWKKTTSQVPHFKKLTTSIPKADVCIIGAGIFGLSCALKLVEQNKKVVILESNKVAAGVTAFSTAKCSALQKLTPLHIHKKFGKDVARLYTQFNLSGLKDILQNIKKFNIDCDYNTVTDYTYTTDENDVESVKETAFLLQDIGINAAFVKETDLPFPVKAAVALENQGVFNSYSYCIGLARELERLNVSIFEDTRVTDVTAGSPHRVSTENGPEVEADKVILATHLPILDRSGHFSMVTPSKSYCVAFQMKEGANVPKGSYISTGEGIHNKSIRTANNGKVLIVAGCGHPQGDPINGSTLFSYQELERFAQENFQVGDKICQWSALDYYTADGIPYIGYLSHFETSIFMATGFSKWGFTSSVAASQVIADLMNGIESDYSRRFDSRRWDLAKSTLNTLEFQAHVTKHFVVKSVQDFFTAPDIEDLQKDSGGICKKNGNLVAAYKDTNGEVHCISSKCSHLGCELTWNQGDKQWDCPCHGSVFSINGEVKHGPAVKRVPEK